MLGGKYKERTLTKMANAQMAQSDPKNTSDAPSSAREPAPGSAMAQTPPQAQAPAAGPAPGPGPGQALAQSLSMAPTSQPPRQTTSSAPPSEPAPTSALFSTVFGLLVVFGVIGGIGVWGGTAPLASAVVAEAFVAVDSHRKSVQHVDGGVVDRVLVRDGASVRAGEPVVVLDETRPRASYEILRSNLDSLLAIEARLKAERDGLRKISFPRDLLSRRNKPEVADLIRGQARLFSSRRESLDGELGILEQRRAQLTDEIKGLEAQYGSKTKELNFINDELTSLKGLFRQGLASKPRILALEREAAKISGQRGEISAQIARAKKSIGEAKLQIIQNETRFREKVVTELRENRTRIVDTAERTSAAKTVLERIIIRAPVSGTVVGMTVHNAGAVISQGQVVAEIVPSQALLVVEARVQPIDVDNLNPGQEAEVRFLAFKQRETPTVIGRLEYVSADRLTDQRTGAPYYTARIIVPPEQLKELGDKRIIPGMPAEVIVRTGSRVALDYIIEPILSSVNRAWREH